MSSLARAEQRIKRRSLVVKYFVGVERDQSETEFVERLKIRSRQGHSASAI